MGGLLMCSEVETMTPPSGDVGVLPSVLWPCDQPAIVRLTWREGERPCWAETCGRCAIDVRTRLARDEAAGKVAGIQVSWVPWTAASA